MRPTRRTQPYRRGTGRPAGQTLFAMLAGRSSGAMHPLEPTRQAAKRARRKRSVRRRRNTTYRVR